MEGIPARARRDTKALVIHGAGSAAPAANLFPEVTVMCRDGLQNPNPNSFFSRLQLRPDLVDLSTGSSTAD